MIQKLWSFLMLLGISSLLACQEVKVGDLVPATVIDNPSLPSFTLSDGTKLHLETFGNPNNPVLIVLHGGPGNSYRPYLRWQVFSDAYYVVFWDQRGAGLSERVPNEELTGDQYLKDLNELVGHFSPNNKVYLIGHSWGGAYAAYYVQNYPEKVEKLVLIEPGPMNKIAAENTTGTDSDIFGKEEQAFVNISDYLIPGNDEKADYFRANLTFEEQGDASLWDWREGFRANYYINDWRGLWDGSYTFDFTTGIKENFSTEVLFIAGTGEARLGQDFQITYQAPFFNLYEGSVFIIEGADHNATITSPLTVPKIREYFNQ